MPRTCWEPARRRVASGLVVSTGTDRFAQHVNVGYTFSGSTDVSTYIGDDEVLQSALLPSDTPPDEFHFNGGVEYAATDRLTLLGEFMGRTLAQRGPPRDGRTDVHVHAAGPAGPLAGAAVTVIPGIPGARGLADRRAGGLRRQVQRGLARAGVGARAPAGHRGRPAQPRDDDGRASTTPSETLGSRESGVGSRESGGVGTRSPERCGRW